MKALHLSPASASSPSFALISVLALVSLAALTATAFLASARLERQATMPLTQTTILEMALDAGAECAKEVIDVPLSHFNHVTTYWRGTNATDWTNELGYLLNGSARKTSSSLANRTSTIINYACCFSTATFTNLGTNAGELIVMTNDISSQGTFRSQMSTFMLSQTNFAAGQSTNIPLLGNQTSPPVGWVYIKQDVRVKPGQTNTTNVPVARFAFYVQDLSSMIDAERMGGFTNGTPYRESTALPANYIQGTNPAEISLTNLTGTALTNFANATNFTSTNNRIKYLAPGMLVLSNVGGINPNDLRYVTAGLIHWTNAYRRIPMGLGYSLSSSTNFLLDNAAINSSATLTDITNWIRTNLPGFATNRAGGMSTNNYLAALAANIIDYADTDPTPSTTTVSGRAVIGYDSYPLLTHLYDQFTYDNTARTITHTTWMQFWNPSTKSVGGNVTVTFTNNDTVRYTNSATPPVVVTRPLVTNVVGGVTGVTTTTFTIPSLDPNRGYVTNFTRPAINLADATKFPGFRPVGDPLIAALYINTATANPPSTALPCNNSFSYQWGTATNTPAMTIKRQNDVLNSGVATFCAGFLAGNQYIAGTAVAGTPLPIHDPRMTPYLGLGSANQYAQSAYNTTYWRGYVSQDNPPIGLADPTSWPDASSTNVAIHGTLGSALPLGPTTGLFTNTNPTTGLVDPAPFKISNQGSYTNICELGNIFDPIQWAPPVTTMSDYANCNINTNAGSSWTKNNLYGGGSTLRIGRPEHSSFAWTNVAGAVATPNMQTSAAALLDLFCTTNQFDESGKINLNTAPAPVLRALAGGIYLRSDPNLKDTLNPLIPKTPHPIPPAMAEAFAQGVMRFRAQYPFHSPSQLAFIGTDPNWPNTGTWPSGAVFGNKDPIFLTSSAPGNSSGASATMGVSGWNDQAAEEWFSKIFNLSTTYSRNFRVYVIAQKATNEGTVNKGVGPVVRKYYNVITRCNKDGQNDVPPATFSTRPTLEAPY